MTIRNRLFIALGVLFSVFWIGVAGYMVIPPRMAFHEAVYMVAITLSTVGYREIGGEPSVTQEFWTIGLVVFGISTVAITFSLMTGVLVEGEIGRLIGSRKLESRIKSLSEHVIVCGYGRMGQMVVQHLRETNVPIVVIELDPSPLRKLDELRVLYIEGDATDEDILHRAGIERARALVAVLPSDADKVFVTLTARELRSDLHIVARAEQFTAIPKLRRAGASRVISPQAIGAERIANIITRPHVVDFVEVAAKGVDLELDEFVVGKDSPMANKSLRDADIRRAADVMVVAIKRADGTTQFSPGADVVIQPQDTLIMIGPSGASNKLEEMRVGGEAT